MTGATERSRTALAKAPSKSWSSCGRGSVPPQGLRPLAVESVIEAALIINDGVTVLVDPQDRAVARLFSDLDFEAGADTRIELLRRADEDDAAAAA